MPQHLRPQYRRVARLLEGTSEEIEQPLGAKAKRRRKSSALIAQISWRMSRSLRKSAID